MKTNLARCVLIVLLLQIAATTARAQNVPVSQSVGVARGAELAALEQKLIGAWKGGPCVGDYTFNPDGTFELTHFTPGNNILTGTWFVRWDELPPTLVVTCKTSDFKKRAPSWPEYKYLDKPRELKLLELNSDTFTCRFSNGKEDLLPNDDGERRYKRLKK
jgi:hypothetical protein